MTSMLFLMYILY